MTPFSLFREVPARLGSRPTLWKVLLASALSMTLAVVLMAWQASRFCRLAHHHHHRDHRTSTSSFWRIDSPSTAEIRTRMETACAGMAQMRLTQTGLYAPPRIP
jgi:hypothetical protein